MRSINRMNDYFNEFQQSMESGTSFTIFSQNTNWQIKKSSMC